MSKKVLITFEQRNQPLDIPNSLTAAETFTHIRRAALKQFGLQSHFTLDQIIIQRYDQDWEVDVDLTESDVINNRDKLKINTTEWKSPVCAYIYIYLIRVLYRVLSKGGGHVCCRC